MEREIKSNITVLCLNEKFGLEISKLFADTVSMHFANCKDVIEYDLFDSGEVLTQCGEAYYKKREKQVIKYVCRYENALLFTSYDLFTHNAEEFMKNTTLIYICLPKKHLGKDDSVSALAYEDRDKELREKSDFVIEIKKADTKVAMKEIYNVIGGKK